MAEVIFGFPPSVLVDFSGGFEIRRKSSSPSVRQSSTFEFGEAESGCEAGSRGPISRGLISRVPLTSEVEHAASWLDR